MAWNGDGDTDEEDEDEDSASIPDPLGPGTGRTPAASPLSSPAPPPPADLSWPTILAAITTTLASAATVWRECVFPRPGAVARLTVFVVCASAGLAAAVAASDAAAAAWYWRAGPAIGRGIARGLEAVRGVARDGRRHGAAALKRGLEPVEGDRLVEDAPAAPPPAPPPPPPSHARPPPLYLYSGAGRRRGWDAFEALG